MAGRIVAATALAGLSLTVTTSPASAAPLSSESFHGAKIPSTGWMIGSPKGADSPCATAATATVAGFLPACREVLAGNGKADPDGEGAFRLTDNSSFNAGSLLFDKPIKADRGVSLEFDMYQYKGRPTTDKFGKRGADGIAFYIVDGATTKVDPGEAGGGLGYKGLSGAFVGIGFDEFGNFSSTPGGPGGPGLTPNSVAVRGSASAGYKYIFGKSLDPAVHPLANDAATQRADAKRHVTIDINSKNVMNVEVDFNNGKGPQPVVVDLDLDKLPGQEPLPKTLKVGWAAATGNASAVHEISGFQARTLDADLNLNVTDNGPWQAGQTGAYNLDVAVNANNGWSDDQVKLNWTIPAGVTATAAKGDGWTCTIAGQVVTCTSVTHVGPGNHYPPVKIDVAVGKTVAGTAVATGGIDIPTAVPGGVEANPADNKATSTVSVKAGPALIKLAVGGDKEITAGAGGKVTLTATNAPGAGPSSGPVTVNYEVGPGLTVNSAQGPGWTCTIAGQKVSCTRSDPLPPGGSYPPVAIDVTSAVDTVAGNVPTTALLVGVPGVTVTGGLVVKPAAAQAAVKVTSNPNPYVPGGKFTYTASAANPGPGAMNGASVKVTWPAAFKPLKWKCAATGGAVCPAAEGTGDVNVTVDLPAGGALTYTQVCQMPVGVTASFTASIAVVVPGTGCTAEKPCIATDTNKPALP
ncbi:hypothetical protein Acor_76200 [Acrocarpospora corrugata]|uniref:DUF11 domain-containing protein n=1 Tax=Acrocarpospora corrugata TaxID=35763 RepID=A0A5M3WBX5_9ACTN|nr:hypothetical protein [Acrocarpospora corrugata]GES05552.1 hypothetical protein Acor_76200 [Acrocarpospora corrugata]